MQIDSYVSERRRKRKKQKKYFWSIAIFLAVYLIFLGIIALFFRWPVFHAESITIQGNDVVPQSEIMDLLQASILRKGDSPNAPNSGLKAALGFNDLLIWPDALPSSTVALIPQLAGVTISKNYFLHTITVTVTERQPYAIWCMMPADSCFWFDYQGTIFEQTLDTQGGIIPVIHDYAQSNLTIGDKILPDDFISNMLSILNVLKQSGVAVQEVALHDLSLEEVDVTTINGPTIMFSLHFPSDGDLPVLENLIAKPGFDKLQYIDFTVENRAFYK